MTETISVDPRNLAEEAAERQFVHLSTEHNIIAYSIVRGYSVDENGVVRMEIAA